MELLGNKALRLKELKDKLHLSVPDFVVISSGKSIDTESIKNKIGDGPYAVRSSSQNEDTDGSSQAGQFLTKLAVTEDGLKSAIEEVMAQAGSVIVQKFIEPDFAGVAFTRNPLGGREMVIEYHAGRGEDLVGGKIKPEQFSIYWNEETYNTNLPGLRQAILEFRKIEQFYDFPQDIEWCVKDGKWYFLQTRPISSLSKKDYAQSLFLDNNLPKEGFFYFAKTEISEIAPRPCAETLKLLHQIYAQDGPVDNVYAKYGISFETGDFLRMVGDELFIDKVAELKTLLPSYGFANSHTAGLVRMKGLIRSLKNLFNLSRISLEMSDELFERLREALEVGGNEFLKDYELVFEINLLSSIALKRLDQFLNREEITTTALLRDGMELLPDNKKMKISVASDEWKGNSLDFGDLSKFRSFLELENNVSVETSKWWNELPEFKKRLLKKPIEQALIFNRLREFGRWLVVKHVNRLRSSSTMKAGPTKFDLPAVLSSIQSDTEIGELKGVSAGVAEGILVSLDDFEKVKGPKILYVRLLTPDLVQHFDEIEGIVSEQGGLLSHLSIMAREKGIPVLTNFSLQTASVKIGDSIKIDGSASTISS